MKKKTEGKNKKGKKGNKQKNEQEKGVETEMREIVTI